MSTERSRRPRRPSEEAELETAYRRISGYKGKYRKKPSKNYRLVVSLIVVVMLVAMLALIIGVTAGCAYFMNADLDGIILENVTVAGVDVGGMSQRDAITAVRNATSGTYKSVPMVVKVLDNQIEIPTKYVGSLDVRAAVKAAYKFGNSGSEAQKEQDRNTAMTTGYQVNIIPYLDLNEKAIRDILSDFGANYSSTLTQSTYEITGTAPSQVLTIQLGVPEYDLNLNDLYDAVLASYNNNLFTTEGSCGMIAPDPIDLEAILAQYYIAPINAAFNKSDFTAVEGKNGYGFDIEAAKKSLEDAKYGSTIEIPFTELPPEITAEELSKMLFRDVLATYTGTATSEVNRDENLRLACAAINGIILYPGDSFSYNDALGPRTAANGYKPGPSYSGNKTVYTYGGGICQVSSALYYCALKSEMDILLRKNHGFMPVYMPVGLDATVSWGSIDFRFKNNTDYPVRIEASSDGGTTTVSIIGTELRNYRVELESEILSTTEYSTTYQTMSANNSEGFKDGDVIVEPYTGYHAKTYFATYNKETGELISRTFIAESKYRKRDAIICKISGNTSSTTQPEQDTSNDNSDTGISDNQGDLP